MTAPQSNFRFERIEKKFWMSAEQYEALLPTLERYLTRDDYGETTICNLYYDTPDYALIRESIERPLFKEKLRLRSYGFPKEETPVYVEIKRKLNGIGYKRRAKLPFGKALALLSMEEDDPAEAEQGVVSNQAERQILGEIRSFVHRYHPIPMVLLTYQRYAMYGKEDPRFRVTIDRKLRYRGQTPEKPLFIWGQTPEKHGASGMLPIMEDDSRVLMEIKAEGAIPAWLTDEMSRLGIYQAPFSKIGYCYTHHLASESRAAVY